MKTARKWQPDFARGFEVFKLRRMSVGRFRVVADQKLLRHLRSVWLSHSASFMEIASIWLWSSDDETFDIFSEAPGAFLSKLNIHQMIALTISCGDSWREK